MFQAWLARMGEPQLALHRKGWEHAYIAQALAERDLLRPGRRGLGFAVGQEGLPALFASMGCDVLATDLAPADPNAAGWVKTGQHASDLATTYHAGVSTELLSERVRFRAVDMRAIPPDLRGFDFAWSSCSLEHLGSIARGLQFIRDALACVRPGGWAVHTTEYNLSSNWLTLPFGSTVLFRRRDLESLAAELRAEGHEVDLDFTLGDGWADQYVDRPPYRNDVHLRLRLRWWDITSFGLIIRRSPAADGAPPA